MQTERGILMKAKDPRKHQMLQERKLIFKERNFKEETSCFPPLEATLRE